ncbi:hypothetical protein [Lysobacter arvi]|uniref:Uncharacterized protein n=1 Tax=Lysobacter arvi TaxID=3038776 RepID=A0ABU1CIR8_9GAMM|nr:hypothetical protein [Lysobacter arvi]MDR0184842.1 hypothetical protein [Lysobacter arvi]
MNALTTFAPSAKSVPASPLALMNAPSRNHRERDFGVGYGASSGYASNRRYTTDWAPPRFRFA